MSPVSAANSLKLMRQRLAEVRQARADLHAHGLYEDDQHLEELELRLIEAVVLLEVIPPGHLN